MDCGEKFVLFRRPFPETLWLIGVGLADLVSTVVLWQLGLIVELNPIMRPLLERSVWLFSGVKILTLVAAYVVLQVYRTRDEQFCRLAAKWGAVAYVVVWVVWFTAGHVTR